MTPLTRPVARKLSVVIRDGGKPRNLIVTLHGEFMTLRLAGRRQEETVNLEHAYFGAVKARAFKERMDKAKVKAERAKLSKVLGKGTRR
jgi:hypothetical protein